MAKITAPIPFTGETVIGPLTLQFEDSVAEFPGVLSQEAADLLRAHGYGVEASPLNDPEPVDVAVTVTEETPEPTRPALNASTEAWVEYAATQGHDRGSLEELTRTEIQSLFE